MAQTEFEKGWLVLTRRLLFSPPHAVATGEEEERTVHSVRAKLYAIMKGEGENATSAADGQWKERGTGTVRVNVPKQRGSELGGNAAAARLGEFLQWPAMDRH